MLRVPKYWREIPYRYRLIGSKCKKCGKIYFPPKQRCRVCGSKELEAINLPRQGRLVTYTVVRSAPSGYEKYAPYIVGIIELEGGVRILSQIVDCDPTEITTGMEVEAAFRRVIEQGEAGAIEYGYKFRPIIRP